MAQKVLNNIDLARLAIGEKSLMAVSEGTKVYCPMSVSDLSVVGNAIVTVTTDHKSINNAWALQGISMYNPKSAYRDVMSSPEVGLIVTVYKFGSVFSSAFAADVNVHFTRENKPLGVYIGTVAAKRIETVLPQIAALLLGN